MTILYDLVETFKHVPLCFWSMERFDVIGLLIYPERLLEFEYSCFQ
jgi:hypothetical protein